VKTKLNIIIAGLCIVMAGCSKNMPEENKQKPEVLQQSGDKSAAANPAANPDNPYDYIGVIHNVLLDSLRKYKERSRDTTHAGTVNYLRAYFKKEGSTTVPPVMDKPTGIRIIQDYHPYMLRPEFSKETNAFTRSLMATLDGITGTENYGAYKASIVRTELQIMDSPISPLEKKYLLVTASVLRHSGHHWMKVFSSGLVQKKGLLGFLRKLAGVITGIAADATVVGWHVVKGSSWDVIIEETVTWSEICGYYTGWYPEYP
jgi:hypothetical protein